MKKIKKVVFILIPSTIILIYFLSCSILYFFEPPYYNAPDLSLSGFSFDLYSKYSASKNKNFFIKQITYTDIVKAETLTASNPSIFINILMIPQLLSQMTARHMKMLNLLPKTTAPKYAVISPMLISISFIFLIWITMSF